MDGLTMLFNRITTPPLVAGVVLALSLAACSPQRAPIEPAQQAAITEVGQELHESERSVTIIASAEPFRTPAPVTATATATPRKTHSSSTSTPTITPTATAAVKRAPLQDFGPAPEIDTSVWLNSDQPLRLADLQGQVVLIDFWTYG